MKTATYPQPVPTNTERNPSRLFGWQGFTIHTPAHWDLTGFSGTESAGYFRVDDSEEQAVEIKWATEKAKAKKEPNVEERLDGFFKALHQAARKKRLKLDTRQTEPVRGVERPERNALGFTWVGDRKAIGCVWYCRNCRRVVIAQVLGETSGPRGLTGVAERVLGSLRCHSENPDFHVWSLYDLHTEVPSHYALTGQQLMNVYLRLSFAHKASRLSVEQWGLANIARKNTYLDVWLSLNTKAEMREANYAADEGEAQNHPALIMTGGAKFGRPMVELARQVTRFQKPATRFSGVAWECEPGNKLYLVEGFQTGKEANWVRQVADRTRCHTSMG